MKLIFLILGLTVSSSLARAVCDSLVTKELRAITGTAVDCFAAKKYQFVLAEFPDDPEAEFAGVSYFVIDTEKLKSQGFKKSILSSETGMGGPVLPVKCKTELTRFCLIEKTEEGGRLAFQSFAPPQAGHIYLLELQKDGSLKDESPRGFLVADPGRPSAITAKTIKLSTLDYGLGTKKPTVTNYHYKNANWEVQK